MRISDWSSDVCSSDLSYLTHDLQASVELPWNAKFTLGVNHVTDKMPELIGYDGRPFNFYLYDAYGRTPYMRYVQRFRSFATLQHCRGLRAPLFFPAILRRCRTTPPPDRKSVV